MCESPSEPRADKLNAGCHPLGSSTFECFFNRWFLRSSMLARLVGDLNHESGFDPRQPHQVFSILICQLRKAFPSHMHCCRECNTRSMTVIQWFKSVLTVR